ncbi:hypothetical protein SmJEL517_g02579 [Synchytrium microbalum]|uniref:Uncharacterized protein n=1 Tax=Synchytrium microbalum TaxID=1806994 RepID=A0A507C665_9FUNG|nr:uncharacterized protein SmJEL517_g02579 [Synchytrium microbalum]TPX34838.1 hypothetical protein SmJEL517_g02579 [Synchytrium microbalum]
MFSLYGSLHERYLSNLNRDDKKWINPSVHGVLCIQGNSPTRTSFDSSDSINGTPEAIDTPQEESRAIPSLAGLSLQSSYASNIGEETRNDVRQLDTQIRNLASERYNNGHESTRLASMTTYDTLNRDHLLTHRGNIPHVHDREIRFGIRNDNFGHARLPRDATWAVPSETNLEELRRQEKRLLIELWAQQWESCRPPQTKWYEMASSQFSDELRRNRSMLCDPVYRQRESETRSKILDMHRTLQAETNLFPQ